MSGRLKNIIYGLLTVVLPLSCCLLVSCFNDDYDAESSVGSEQTTMRIHIKTNGISDLNATRADDDETVETKDGETGEFMNTLCIFVVDATTGEIEMKLQPDLSGTSAATGNLSDYTTEEFVLDAGTKNIYAFANWDKTESEDWENLIAKDVGDKINADTLSFTIDDPASKVNIAGGSYIPMSGKYEGVKIGDMNSNTANLNTNAAGNLISVGLDRLVSKVRLKIVADTTDITVDKIYFEGTADNVSLFPISDEFKVEQSDITFGTVEGKTVESGIIPTVATVEAVTEAESVEIASFYINESERTKSDDEDISDSGYTLTLEMGNNSKYDMYDGSKYRATTVRKNVPRNNIYPIKLKFDTYDVKFEITAWTSWVDSEKQEEYTTDAKWHESEGYYEISLRDITSSFEITPKLYSIGEDSEGNKTETQITDDVTWNWSQDDGYENKQDTDENGTLTITQVTAKPGYSYEFNLTVQWTTTSSGATVEHERTYKVRVVLSEGDFTIDGNKYE